MEQSWKKCKKKLFTIRNLTLYFSFWVLLLVVYNKGIIARSSSYALKYNSWSQLGHDKNLAITIYKFELFSTVANKLTCTKKNSSEFSTESKMFFCSFSCFLFHQFIHLQWYIITLWDISFWNPGFWDALYIKNIHNTIQFSLSLFQLKFTFYFYLNNGREDSKNCWHKHKIIVESDMVDSYSFISSFYSHRNSRWDLKKLMRKYEIWLLLMRYEPKYQELWCQSINIHCVCIRSEQS